MKRRVERVKNFISCRNTAIGFYAGAGLRFTRRLQSFSSAGLWMIAFPLFIIFMAVVFEYSGLDIWWESFFFNASSHSWPYRDHWLFEQVIHEGGRLLDNFAAGIWLVAFITSLLHKPFRRYQKPLLYFLIAAIAGPVIIGIIKQTTHIYTPWEITPFFGQRPYIRLFDHVPDGLPVGEAFPAGHASGGYAFFSLYFLLHQLGIHHKKYGLAAGLILGGIYGFGQQVRGAHFPSHDLFTMVICWYAAFFTYYLFFPKKWRTLIYDPNNF